MMAVFLVNVCKFNQCGLTFPSLPDLIQHIESTHIGQKLPDIDEPSQSICLPFSYVQRYVPVDNRREINALAVASPTGNSTDQSNTTEGIGTANPTSVQSVTPVSTASTAPIQPSSPEDHAGVQLGSSAGGSSGSIGSGGARNSTDLSGGTGSNAGAGSSGPSLPSTSTNGAATTATESPSKASAPGNNQNSGDLKRRMAVKTHHTYSMSSSNRSTTPTGSEMDDDDMMGSESEDSNDSWTTEEFSSEFIMRYGSRRVSTSGGHGINVANEKPFACPVPGCKKRYKNVNGIKYHSKNGHKKDGNRVRKGFKCFCGKSYKTSVRLRNHNLIAHPQGNSGDSMMTTAQQPVSTTSQPVLAAASSGSPVLYTAGMPVSLTVSQAASFATNSTAVGAGVGGHKPTSPHSNHHVPAVNSSSQISRNANSPTAVTITQQPSNKIARTTNSSSITTTTATAAVAATGNAVTVVTTIASSLSATSTSSTATSANIGNSASSCNGLPTMGGGAGFPSSAIMHTVVAGSSSIKYDNLGILTPATSPKLITGVNADSSGGSHTHSTNPSHLAVAVPATTGGGTSPTPLGSGGGGSSSGSVSTIANSTTAPASAGPGGGQLTVVGANGAPSPITNGGGSSDGPALCDGGVDGTLGIALVVSNLVGDQLNINNGNGSIGSSSGTSGTAGGGGTVVLSASPATSQLYGEGT
ncbi:uncharacterized transmembrane protein DDB_G0289901 [Anopheles aquasalis]|uniref:uncharacterized transmembrane protein DDB_G0289901 n=1 Tax=Anopheles aquasalis TaxID=42839 RepID=UPI00215AD1A3|nr:uncharacterized transmembrane protein DDB_G0289901 [Anopheles aquasalis]